MLQSGKAHRFLTWSIWFLILALPVIYYVTLSKFLNPVSVFISKIKRNSICLIEGIINRYLRHFLEYSECSVNFTTFLFTGELLQTNGNSNTVHQIPDNFYQILNYSLSLAFPLFVNNFHYIPSYPDSKPQNNLRQDFKVDCLLIDLWLILYVSEETCLCGVQKAEVKEQPFLASISCRRLASSHHWCEAQQLCNSSICLWILLWLLLFPDQVCVFNSMTKIPSFYSMPIPPTSEAKRTDAGFSPLS